MLTVTDRTDQAATLDGAAPLPMGVGATSCHADVLMPLLVADGWRTETALEALGRHLNADRWLDLVTDCARVFGDWWLDDRCSFADVTLGLHRLTLLLIAVEQLPDADRRPQHGGRVLLAVAPDDQHGFGLALVAFALRRQGWDVTLDLSGDPATLMRHLERQSCDAVALSVGHERAVAPVGLLIRRIKDAAAGRGGRRPILAVGGPMLTLRPRLAEEVGADLACSDAAMLAARLSIACLAHAA